MTDYVIDDEPCYNLSELNLVADDGKFHRYQILAVMRGDRLAEYKEDMGLTKDFKAHQLRVMGGDIQNNRIYIEETVASLREEANLMRDETPLNIRELTNC